jgi:hypothetical protein
MKLHSKLAAVAAAVLAGACGTESQTGALQDFSCTLKVRDDPRAINEALQQVHDGTLDACNGALTAIDQYSAEAVRIDRLDGSDAGYVDIVFMLRLRRVNGPLPQMP